MQAFVIGNASYRKEYDLAQLPGMTLGCNYIAEEDFVPDVLVSIDERAFGVLKKVTDRDVYMLERKPERTLKPLRAESVSLCKKFPRRRTLKPVPMWNAYSWDSGRAATDVAIALGANQVFMIGFTFGQNGSGDLQNAHGVKLPRRTPLNTQAWQEHFQHYPNIDWFRVGPDDDDYYNHLKKWVRFISWEECLDRIQEIEPQPIQRPAGT